MRDSIKQRFYPSNGAFKEMKFDLERKKFVLFANNILFVHYYLLRKNVYFPSPKADVDQRALPRVEEPIFISHRGNINGKQDPLIENSRVALDAVIESGFEWVEIDIQMTKDGELVVMHDSYIEINGEILNVNKITLEELRNLNGLVNIFTLEELIEGYSQKINLLIEIKVREHVWEYELLHITREVARIVKNGKSLNKIIIDSFDEEIVTSIKNQCDCVVGFDMPYKVLVSEQKLLNAMRPSRHLERRATTPAGVGGTSGSASWRPVGRRGLVGRTRGFEMMSLERVASEMADDC